MGFILDCRSASRLVSRELDGPLPRGRRMLLRVHLFWCDPCRALVDQMHLLRKAIQRYRS